MTGYKAFELGIPSSVIRDQQQYAEQREHAERVLQQLKETERVLEILRPISPEPRTLDQPTIEKFLRVLKKNTTAATFCDGGQHEVICDPTEYFAQRFPEQIKNYGPVFFGSPAFMNGREVFIAESINEDAMAAVLGGDQRLGQQVVFYKPEDLWYYQDYRVVGAGAYCPTSEEKMSLLASNWIIRCSQACNPISAKAILKLRTPQNIKSIITTAKTMLEAEKSFFSGKEGKKRMVDGKLINPVDTPLHEIFIKDVIVPEPEGRITLTDCYHKYYRFCRDQGMPAPTRTEFQAILVDAIRSAFNVGLRHDVPGPNGKQGNGWRGIAYRQDSRLITTGLN